MFSPAPGLLVHGLGNVASGMLKLSGPISLSSQNNTSNTCNEFEWKDSRLLPFSPCVYAATEAKGGGDGGGREGESPS